MGCGAGIQTNHHIAPEEITFKGKIIVIGAGAAGMVAGHLLKEQGIDFQILEASSRFGGRAIDAAEGFADFRLPLGAEFIQKTAVKINCPIFEDIISGKSEEYVTYPLKLEKDFKYVQDGKLKSSAVIVKLANASPSESKFARSSWYNVLETRILPSVKDSIVYDSPVTEINYEKDQVTVKTKNGTMHQANKVLVCVPIPVLQQDLIAFSPPIPANQVDALKSVTVVPGVKVFMEFKEQFYPSFITVKHVDDGSADHAYLDATRKEGGKKVSEKNILCGIFNGDEIYRLVTQNGTDDESIKNYVLRELDGFFDGQATKNLVNHLILNWTTAPYAGIAYNMFPKKSKQLQLSTPLLDKVFFAGDAMHPAAPRGGGSYVHVSFQGACETAYIAVKAMLTSSRL